MTTKRKHHKVIKAWANGAEIEMGVDGFWECIATPSFLANTEYRVKKKVKPNFTVRHEALWYTEENSAATLIELEIDGETNKAIGVRLVGQN